MDAFALKLITGPTMEPVTVAEAKLHTHISHSVEDALIAEWIKSARILAANTQRRAYVNEIWEMSFDKFPKSPIYIARAPLVVLMSIKYYDYQNTETVLYEHATDPQTTTTTVSPGSTTTTTTTPAPTGAATFIIDTNSEPGRVSLAYATQWPVVTLRPIDAIRIRFGAGYGPTAATVPETVKDAIKLYVAYRNENRAGEVESVPKQFYNILEPDRMHCP